ncbi:MAG: HIT domain-containing protein [Candidatus Krumholzibacteriia bacterium]
MAAPGHCPFCSPSESRVVRSSEFGSILRDKHPVSPGHLLVVPHRHVGSFFDLDPLEQADLLNLIVAAQRVVRDHHEPDAVNVGLNDGPAAGQTIEHCHWHVIPRFAGDVDDPRGGVRWVVPEKAAYWESGV